MERLAPEGQNVWDSVLGPRQMLPSVSLIQSMQLYESIQRMKLIIQGRHRQLKQLRMNLQLEQEEGTQEEGIVGYWEQLTQQANSDI